MVLSPLNILIIAFLLAEAGLLAYNLLRRRTDTERLTWLSAAIITAFVVTGLQLLPAGLAVQRDAQPQFCDLAGAGTQPDCFCGDDCAGYCPR